MAAGWSASMLRDLLVVDDLEDVQHLQCLGWVEVRSVGIVVEPLTQLGHCAFAVAEFPCGLFDLLSECE